MSSIEFTPKTSYNQTKIGPVKKALAIGGAALALGTVVHSSVEANQEATKQRQAAIEKQDKTIAKWLKRDILELEGEAGAYIKLRAGSTLWSISGVLDDPDRDRAEFIQEIEEVNPDLPLVQNLQPGQKINLPQEAAQRVREIADELEIAE